MYRYITRTTVAHDRIVCPGPRHKTTKGNNSKIIDDGVVVLPHEMSLIRYLCMDEISVLDLCYRYENYADKAAV